MSQKPDLKFMELALKLAQKGKGMTSPNPLVGAVLVRSGKIIGKGYHKKAGLNHAEIEAFEDARKKGNKIAGCDLYVNLEPCCHKGKRTPPCTAMMKITRFLKRERQCGISSTNRSLRSTPRTSPVVVAIFSPRAAM